MGQQYHVRIHNQSDIDDQNLIVFQQQPDLPEDVQSLAWLSKMCHAGTSLDLYWTVDLNFVWGQESDLRLGVDYRAGQVVDADLTAHNKVNLLYEDDGYKFGPVVAGPAHGEGSLFISQGPDVPGYGNKNQGCVGIGMSRSGTFVVPTNMDGGGGIQFTVRPTYWIAWGSHAPGIVVSQDILRFPQMLQFPAGEFFADCRFNGRDWELSYQ